MNQSGARAGADGPSTSQRGRADEDDHDGRARRRGDALPAPRASERHRAVLLGRVRGTDGLRLAVARMDRGGRLFTWRECRSARTRAAVGVNDGASSASTRSRTASSSSNDATSSCCPIVAGRATRGIVRPPTGEPTETGSPADCAEVRSFYSTTTDGHFGLLVDGFPLTIYCHGMNDTLPRTYIDLDPATNYAEVRVRLDDQGTTEVYNRRLSHPFTCPHDGQRNDSCACIAHDEDKSGMTRFSKVRIDLRNMKLNSASPPSVGDGRSPRPHVHAAGVRRAGALRVGG